MADRIQKVLASAGVASRRAVEDMIAEGRVTVNGRPAEVGQKIDHNDHVRVDGRSIALSRKPESARVLLYRKRTGEVVTRDDPEGRRTVFRKLPELEGSRWIAVGRLDVNTSGLLLLTNDGELARRLMHPSFEIKREYAVRVLGEVNAEVLDRLRKGVKLEDGFAKVESIKAGGHQADDEAIENSSSANSWWTVLMGEGRNRIVRRLFESQNLQVSRLIRIAYGPVQLGRGIKSGSYREATPEELAVLKQAVGLAEAAPVKAARKTVPSRRTTSDRDESSTRNAPDRKATPARKTASGRGTASDRKPASDKKTSSDRRPAPDRKPATTRKGASPKAASSKKRPPKS